MTDTAPPARSALTAEQWARELASWNDYDDLVRAIGSALTAARAEGRLAGLREAAELAESLTWLRREDREFLKAGLRRLAGDRPKAP